MIRKEAPLPVGKWIERTASDRGISVNGLARLTGDNSRWLQRARRQTDMPMTSIEKLVRMMMGSVSLTQSEKEHFSDALVETILFLNEDKGRIREVSPVEIKRRQREQAQCTTYTGEQAGEMLGVSRQAVRIWRGKLGIENTILSPQQVDEIGSHIKKKKINI